MNEIAKTASLWQCPCLPLINQNGPASALPLLLFLVTGAEVGVGVLGPAPAAGLLGTADMALHAAAASDGVFLY